MSDSTQTFAYTLTVSELKQRSNSNDIRVLNAGNGNFWVSGEMQGPVSTKYDSTKEKQFAVTHEGVAILCNAGNGASLVETF